MTALSVSKFSRTQNSEGIGIETILRLRGKMNAQAIWSYLKIEPSILAEHFNRTDGLRVEGVVFSK